jgi:hypothetical protein
MFWHKGDFGMTFDDFKEDILAFLKDSTVNLGRKSTKTREIFLSTIREKLDTFGATLSHVRPVDVIPDEDISDDKTLPTKKKADMLRIDPTECRRNPGAVKGAHVMTASESMRSDKQHSNSPFVDQSKKEGDHE